MIGNVKLIWAAALGLAAAILPFSARAGTSTSTGTVSMLINPGGCEVAGTNIDLGTFQANQTWRSMGERLGYVDENSQWVRSTMGNEYVTFGTILCDVGMPYTLSITGSETDSQVLAWWSKQGAVRLPLSDGRVVRLLQTVKTIDGQELNNANWPGMGQTMTGGITVTGVGNAVRQVIRGHMLLALDVMDPNGPRLDDRINQSGVLSDTLTYTLTF